MQASSEPTSGQHALQAPVLNGSTTSASSTAAPGQSCVGSCSAASGNSVSYPLTVPVASPADLCNAATGSGIGEVVLTTSWWVEVPADTYSSSQAYTATLTLTISTGP
ncbi:MAG TPA: hypothetical protein VMD59_23095 [Acidimicrobiales bacterium]|nr:hypothetical protein [Acidimicrobiales bacterium]